MTLPSQGEDSVVPFIRVVLMMFLVEFLELGDPLPRVLQFQISLDVVVEVDHLEQQIQTITVRIMLPFITTKHNIYLTPLP